jgi:hypothetical protein
MVCTFMSKTVDVECYNCLTKVLTESPDEIRYCFTFDKSFTEGEKIVIITRFNHERCGFRGNLYWFEEPSMENDQQRILDRNNVHH